VAVTANRFVRSDALSEPETMDWGAAEDASFSVRQIAWIDFGREACKGLAKRLPPRFGRLLIGRIG
jgi:hypothetical protein